MSTKVQNKWGFSPQAEPTLCVFKFITENIAVPADYIAEKLGIPIKQVNESLHKLRYLNAADIEDKTPVWSVSGTRSVYERNNEYSDPMRIVAFLHSNGSASASLLDSIAFRSEENIQDLIAKLSPLVVESGGSQWGDGEITPIYDLNEAIAIRIAR